MADTAPNVDPNRKVEEGSYNIRLSVSEFDELIALIDDVEVDEDMLRIIRRRLVKKRHQARRRSGELTEYNAI